jgi:predicted double-glycine peptidase
MAAADVMVPPVVQETDYTCGPACLRAVLRHFGITRAESTLARELNCTPADGTLPRDIIRVAREYGFTALSFEKMGQRRLSKAVKAGHPVIIAIQAWADRSRPNYATTDDNGHYVVVVGADRKGVRILDPVPGTEMNMSWKTLRQRWHDQDGEDEPYEQLGVVIKRK